MKKVIIVLALLPALYLVLCFYMGDQAGRDLFKILFEKGHSINQVHKENGFTPLLLSLFHKDTKMFQLILENGADLNLTTVSNRGHPWAQKIV